MKKYLTIFILSFAFFSFPTQMNIVSAVNNNNSGDSQENLIVDAATVKDIINDIRPDNAPTPLEEKVDAAIAKGTIGETIKSLLDIAIGLLAGVSGTFALVMIIFQSFKYATSGGDEAKIKAAGKGILYACIGLLGIILSYAIITTIITIIYNLANIS